MSSSDCKAATSRRDINARAGAQRHVTKLRLKQPSVASSLQLCHCTLAVTDALAVSVNTQVFLLLPPLEQAPDQTASRPFETASVIDVPVVNDADPVLPTETLIPAGVDVTRSPLRPLAVTVSVVA